MKCVEDCTHRVEDVKQKQKCVRILVSRDFASFIVYTLNNSRLLMLKE